MADSKLGTLGMGAAASAAGGIIDQGLGMIFAGINDKRQRKQQKALNEDAAEINRRNADYTFQLNKKMWDETNAEAQMEHYKNAGLNPALMYGTGGAGGSIASGGNAQGVSGGSAADAASTMKANQGMGMMNAAQLALLTAQKENIEADTANKRSTIPVNETKAAGQQIDNEIKGETRQDIVAQAAAQTQKLRGEATSAFQKGAVDEATQLSKITQINAEAAGALIENELKKSNISKNTAQIEEIKNSIKQKYEALAQGWKGLDIQQQNTEINKFGQEIKAAYPNVMSVMGRGFDEVLDDVRKLLGNNRVNKRVE